ncbi:MAG: 50S ribosomal protein L11 methyltransferase [Ilumatobacter sp.]|uniref:50S ribosomal protein L11 methyltransferase n=1 Tax=Ilumatobacter sp. TaxID=1967498 RepID=UPI003C78FA19
MSDPEPQIERTIVVTVDAALADIVTDRLWQLGVRAVSEVGLPDGRVDVSTSVGNDDVAIARATGALDPAWPVEVRDLDASIVQVAAEFLSPTWYSPGKVCIPASCLDAKWSGSDPIDSADLVTVIDQGSAFGLGDHPTTRTSMALLAQLLDSGDQTCDRLLDVGCGTGALAVLAAQLGVPTIRAIDIADAAVESTLRNETLNDVVGRIEVDTTPVAMVDGRWDVIMANILAPVLISMADDFHRLLRPGGSLIISGILADRHDHVLAALDPLTPVDSLTHEGWISIELR